ncbi:MAG: Hsp20/alpha crystallin family protein [Lentisphaerota bacterium]
MMKDIVPLINKGNRKGMLRKKNDDFFSDMYASMNQAFGDIVNEFGGFELSKKGFAFNPDFDINETEHEYNIKAELSGLDEKDIEVTLENNVLRISGEKKEEKTENKAKYHISERKFGCFERSFALQSEVDSSKIKASFAKGILSVQIPKTEKAKVNVKKIEIASEGKKGSK